MDSNKNKHNKPLTKWDGPPSKASHYNLSKATVNHQYFDALYHPVIRVYKLVYKPVSYIDISTININKPQLF
jgi:hypothetical protein